MDVKRCLTFERWNKFNLISISASFYGFKCRSLIRYIWYQPFCGHKCHILFSFNRYWYKAWCDIVIWCICIVCIWCNIIKMYILSNSNLNQTSIHRSKPCCTQQKESQWTKKLQAAMSNIQAFHCWAKSLQLVLTKDGVRPITHLFHHPKACSISIIVHSNSPFVPSSLNLNKTQSTVYVQVIVQDVSSQFN